MSLTMPILWIHGWAANPAAWGDLPAHLGASEDCYADFSTVRQPADLLATLRDQCPSEPFAVVGWSMGAMLALELSADAAVPVRRVAVIAGSPCFCSSDPDRGWGPRFLQRMQRNLERTPEQVLAAFADQMFTDAEIRAGYRETWRREVEARGPDADIAGLRAGLQYLEVNDLRPLLASLTVPVLWIHGDADTICPRGCLDLLPTPPLRVRELRGCGHVPFFTQAPATRRLLRNFLHA